MRDPLPDGGTIRKIWPLECGRYREHLMRLDPASRHNRFGGAVSDAFLASYADLALGLDTVIHGFFVHGTIRGAAELRSVGAPMAREAEAAFSIETPWQSHGVGAVLLERTLLVARNRNIKFLHLACIADNERMRRLARKFGAQLTFDFGSVAGELAAPHPTPFSVMLEIVADSHGFATALIEVQSCLFKTA